MLIVLPFVLIGMMPATPAVAAGERVILAQAPAAPAVPETEEQRKKRLEEERKKREQQRPQQRPQPPQAPTAQPPQRPQPPAAQPQQPPSRPEQRPAQQTPPPPAAQPQRREVQEPRPTAPSAPPPARQETQQPQQQQQRTGQPPDQRRDPRQPDRQRGPERRDVQQPPAGPGAAPPPPARQETQPQPQQQQQQQRTGQPPDQRRDPRQPDRQRGPERRDVQQPPAPTPGAAPPPARQDAQPPQQQPRIGQPPPPAIAPAPGGAPPRQDAGQDRGRIDDMRTQRRERVEGGRTIIEEPGRRVIVREQGRTIIRHDETDRFRRLGRDVRVEEGRGGERVTIYRRPDGVQIVSVMDTQGRLLRRSRRGPDGREFVLIENAPRFPDQRMVIVDLPPPRMSIPRERYIVESERVSREELYETLAAPPVEQIDRRYTLDEVRYNYNLRARMRQVDLDTINFEFGSWEVTPDQVPRLEKIAFALNEVIRRNPDEVLLVEGHTDAVGGDDDNLSLSDRRAESVAAILSEHYQVPPENLTTQGYGEQHLKVRTEAPERQNRRVTVRRITPLLASGR